MKILSGICFGLLMSAAVNQAAIWRVDNNSGVDADFTTIQEAHDGAQAGDSLYMHGSIHGYGPLVMTKKLSIYGPGYFLSENPDTQARRVVAQVDSIDIKPGSEGSVITGMFVQRPGTLAGDLTVTANDVVVKRNYVIGSIVVAGAANVIVVQNFAVASIGVHSSAGTVLISNNLIEGGNLIVSQDSGPVTATQNQVANVSIHNTTFQNNVVRSSYSIGVNVTHSHNILIGVDDPNSANIKLDSDTGFFVGGTSSDGKWRLAENSPARGAGISNEDIGPFGGGDPYVLSGIPNIPSIFHFAAPATVTSHSGLAVRIKARANR